MEYRPAANSGGLEIFLFFPQPKLIFAIFNWYAEL